MQRQGATDEAREALVRLWERMASFWGVTPGAARVHAWLVSREAGADAEELMEGLAMSRGAVSMACRELAEWGLAHAEREPGSRRQLWRTETDLEKVVRTIVQTHKRREWDPILEHLREWIPKLEEQRSAEAAVFRARLEAIESIVALADSMAESFLGGGVVQRLGLRALTGAAQRSRAKARKGRKNT